VVAEGALIEDASQQRSDRAFDLARSSSTADVARTYREAGVPPQLAQVLTEEDDSIALRVYILDNSGSMNAGDGQYLTMDGQVVRTTRWAELKQMATKHAEWNAKLGVASEFVLLNSPNPSRPVDGRDLVRIDAQKGCTQTQVADLHNLLNRTSPGQGTPLTERLHDLTQRLRHSAPELREKGRKLMLILVTDGIPNGSRDVFANAIRQLANEHPVHIVVRLCTNEESVSEFYDEVDQELELSLDILDDFQGEAKSIHHLNPWFTYPSILHTVREAGTLSKLLDFIDERPLTPMEAGLFAQLVLRSEGQPKYSWQPHALLEAVGRDVALAPLVYCARRRGNFPIVEITAFRAVVHPGKYSLTGQLASAVGLGGVAEAWYEGRTLLDAFQHPKVSKEASTAKGSLHCAICPRETDGVYQHCCRTCQRSGGKEHGPSCQRRNCPPLVQPADSNEILNLGAVPEGVCFLCARGTDGMFPHCCRTCKQSGGTRHGPTCERKFAVEGYPQARKGNASIVEIDKGAAGYPQPSSNGGSIVQTGCPQRNSNGDNIVQTNAQ
jgi:Mg-chelatase subunit ChlD